MKRMFGGLVLVTLAALLSGCYYQPSYGYVRASPYAGPAYYGTATVYNEAYYPAPGWYGYGWNGGYGYGCCYAPGVVVGGVWYDHWGHRHYHGGGYVHGHGPGPVRPPGGWHGPRHSPWRGHVPDNHR